MPKNLKTKIGKLTLKNPIILASGTFNRSITKKINVSKLGGIVTKTITPKKRKGNPPPKIIKTKYGFLNSDGWQNSGINKFISEELPFWQQFNTEIVPSIGGFSDRDFVDLAKKLNDQDVNAIEINISCPNVHKEMGFSSDVNIIKNLIRKIRKVFKKIIIVKLPPDIINIVNISKTSLDSGADALTIANTYPALELKNQKPIFYRKNAALSGPAIKPMTLRIVAEVHKKLKCPIIASGGIEDIDDVLDYFACGSKAVQIGSANFKDPKTSIKILNKLKRQNAIRRNSG